MECDSGSYVPHIHLFTCRPIDDEELRIVLCVPAAVSGDPVDSDALAGVPLVDEDDGLWLATAESTEVVTGALRGRHEHISSIPSA